MLAPPAPPSELLDPEVHACGDPHAIWAWMRDNAPVYWHPPGRLPGFWSLTRYEDVRAAYADPATFSSAGGVLLRPRGSGEDPGGGLTLALTDPPDHRKLRAMMAQWFTERAAMTLEDTVRRRTRELLGRARASGGCDFVHDVATPLTLAVTCHILGVPECEEAALLDWAVVSFDSGRSLAAHQGFMTYLHELMERRLAHPTDDLMSRLVHGDAGGRLLGDDEILLNCENLVGATENAGLSLATGVLALVRHPGQWARLAAEPGLMPTAADEILRWASSATHSMRTVRRPVTLHGQDLAPGDRVVLWLPSANRDERTFADPFAFDITRRPNRHLALGFGEHVCIGAAVARLQTRILLSELADPDFLLELSGPVTPLASLAVNGPAKMPVRIGGDGAGRRGDAPAAAAA